MPIYKGIIDGGKQDDSEMFYVVTDTTDAGNAEALGINHSSKLHYGNTGRGARKAYLRSDTVRSGSHPVAAHFHNLASCRCTCSKRGGPWRMHVALQSLPFDLQNFCCACSCQ